jgi:ketosteroid isomerase-like protein
VLRRRLFEPLGMAQARYRAPLADDPLRALPHELENGEPQPADYISGGFASGGISMSAADAVAFALALQDGRFLPANLADTAWTPARLGDGTEVELQMFGQFASYGFGWFLARYDGRSMMTHGGGIEGYSANLYHFPEERLTIVVLANTKGRDDGTAPVDPLARRLADLCLERDGCRPAPEEARLRSAITAANRAFSRAYLAGDTAAIRQMYARDALALPPHGRAVTGARGIAMLFASPRNSRRVHHALYTEKLVPTGAGAVELGSWYDRWETGAGDEGAGAATGRYILTWIRDGDEWQIATDAWVPAR